MVPRTLWGKDDVGSNRRSKNEMRALFPNEASFDTPKPERLVERIFQIATNPGDLVLDSFLGSGTTAAVAQKMGRRYIGIEMGDHAETHCQPRLKKVVEGEQGGISEAVNWKGGGGFRYYRLGVSVFDETGQIRPDIEFQVLAAHVWFSEVRSPWSKPDPLSPVLGVHDGRTYALLYNGILGDKSASGGNVLTRKTLAVIRDALPADFAGPITVYGERSALNPTAIIEFTATPRTNSNILHSVSAQELKDEQMIKLQVMLSEHQTWQAAVTGAISKRADLAEDARREHDYVRPLVLFQAQNKDEEVTVAVLRQHLIDVEGIDPNSIAVVTGDQRGLDGIDLFDPDCPIDFIITVEALKEGWDCSFAYVFCSVANIHSATDAEQLLGRVLRMPYAERQTIPSLNRAYANLTSKSFSEAAHALKDRLVSMGFEEGEAEDNIIPEQLDLNEGLFGHARRPQPSVTVSLDADPVDVKELEAVAPSKVRVIAGEDGKAVVKITGFLSPAEKEKLIAVLPEAEVGGFSDQVASYEAEHLHQASPAERGETFTVPALKGGEQHNNGQFGVEEQELNHIENTHSS